MNTDHLNPAPPMPRNYLSVPKSKEMVDHPSHYQTSSGMEVIDVIEAFNLGFCLGNVVKYVLRCGKKTDDEIQELKKAKWYLEREIANRENSRLGATKIAPRG